MKPYPWVDNIEPYIEQFLREQTFSPIVSIPTFLRQYTFSSVGIMLMPGIHTFVACPTGNTITRPQKIVLTYFFQLYPMFNLR